MMQLMHTDLTGAGGTGDQQVGHLVDIEYDGTPGHPTAEAGGDAALAFRNSGVSSRLRR